MRTDLYHDYNGRRSAARADEIADWYVNLGASGARIVLDDQAVRTGAGRGDVRRLRSWDETMRYTHDQIGVTVRALRRRGLRVVFVLWPHPELSTLQQSHWCNFLREILTRYRPDGIELDCELYNFWAERYSDVTRRRLVEQVREVVDEHNDKLRTESWMRKTAGHLIPTSIWTTSARPHCRLAITHEASLLSRAVSLFGEIFDEYCPQAYSVSRMYEADGAYGPGRLQERVIDDWRDVSEGLGAELVIALPAYGQAWDTLTPREALDRQYSTVAQAGYATAIWSADNLDSPSREVHRQVVMAWTRDAVVNPTRDAV